jgi:hypothetical protein
MRSKSVVKAEQDANVKDNSRAGDGLAEMLQGNSSTGLSDVLLVNAAQSN